MNRHYPNIKDRHAIIPSHPLWQRFKDRVIQPLLLLGVATMIVASLFLQGCAVVNAQCEYACERTPTGYVAVRRNCAIDERHGFVVFASRCADNDGPRYH